ncbi:MAG: hypothetical protein ABIO55_09390 [Ginsengibacter sp.]
MKKVIVLFVLAFSLVSITASAQNGERYKQILKDSLQFTDVQIDTVLAVRQVFQPQMRDIFMDQSMSAEDKKTKLAAISEQMRPGLKTVLSDEQIQKMEALQQRMRDRRNNGGGN